MKSNRFSLVVVLLLMALLMSAGLVSAAENGKMIAGLGVGFAPDYEGSDDYEAVPIPRFEYHWDSGRNVVLFGNELTSNLLVNDMWSAGPLLRYRGERDDVDSNEVDAMQKVDAAVELGAFVSLKIDSWKFELNGAHDVSDEHEGYVVELKGSYTHSFNPDLALILLADTSYASDDYMETYFGINAGNRGTSTLDNFDIDGGMKDVGIGATVVQKFSEQWEFMYLVKYTSILEDAKDSPVVDVEGDSGQFMGGVLASYRF